MSRPLRRVYYMAGRGGIFDSQLTGDKKIPRQNRKLAGSILNPPHQPERRQRRINRNGDGIGLKGQTRLVCVQPVKTRLYGQRGATGTTSLIINHLRCNIWRNICATGAQHIVVFLCPVGLDEFLGFTGQRVIVLWPQEGGFLAIPRTNPPNGSCHSTENSEEPIK